jgi:hypothetical protein
MTFGRVLNGGTRGGLGNPSGSTAHDSLVNCITLVRWPISPIFFLPSLSSHPLFASIIFVIALSSAHPLLTPET